MVSHKAVSAKRKAGNLGPEDSGPTESVSTDDQPAPPAEESTDDQPPQQPEEAEMSDMPLLSSGEQAEDAAAAAAIAVAEDATAAAIAVAEDTATATIAVAEDTAGTTIAVAEDTAAAAIAAVVAEEIAATDEPKAKRTRMSWNDRFEQLKAFKELNGHCLVNIRYKENPTLGKWVNNQREQYKTYMKQLGAAEGGDAGEVKAKDAAETAGDGGGEGEAPVAKKKILKPAKCPMIQERVDLLESVGFVWSTNREKQFDEGWSKRLEELKEYREEYGDCLVPHGYTPNPSLAEWVHRQRCTFVSFMKTEAKKEAELKEGKETKERASRESTRKRMDILKDLGFAFRVKEDTWSSRLQELKEYRARHGDCTVPINYADKPSLGRWVHTQRHQYKLFQEKRQDGKRSSKSSMTEERIALLNAEGFNWEVRAVRGPKMAWDERFDELQKFYEKMGHCRVPADNAQLNRWCNDQRTRLKTMNKDGVGSDSKLTAERVSALAGLGFTATSS